MAAEEPMDVDPEDDGINQDKMKWKSKKALTKKGSIIAMDNSDAVDGSGERGIGISSNMKGKGKVSMRGGGRQRSRNDVCCPKSTYREIGHMAYLTTKMLPSK